jgi:sugar phosphate isomerase/epimerase
MKILFLFPRWGSAALPPERFVELVVAEGYDGIEIGFEDGDRRDAVIPPLARKAGLVVVTQHFATFTTDLDAHCRDFGERLRRAASFEPDFINSQTGRDLFDLAKNLRIFDTAARIAEQTGIPIHHETHRARCLHTPWRTAELLRERPETRLAFDMSHWCNVCETLLEDQEDTLWSIVPSVVHLHARVGHAQGPQVGDPRAPECRDALDAHLKWWDRIVRSRRDAGSATLTITPEFGPPPYFPTLPWTQAPVGNQWETNVHMMRHLRERYKNPATI